MSDEALYVYGIVKMGFFDLDWSGLGLDGKEVYIIREGEFSALVHDCEERPYLSEDAGKIKNLILAHNKILNRALSDFGGVIPLPFNTIIKKGENSAEDSLKTWLGGDRERLGSIWNKIKGKKEYGLRIYYDKNKLLQKISNYAEIEELEKRQEGKSIGLSYLLQEEAKGKIKELAHNRLNEYKQKFHDVIKKVVDEVKINPSKISLEEEKELLFGLSLLTDEKQIIQINMLDSIGDEGFSFQLAGPFPPYSFVENENQ